MAENRVWALKADGTGFSWCTCTPEERGRGRCNHVAHQEPNESVQDFVNRLNKYSNKDGSYRVEEIAQEVTQQEVDTLASKIDEIAGCHVTTDNLKDVLKTLTPDQVAQIASIGFDAAPQFSLPIKEGEYEQKNVETKLYFSNLWKYGAGGSKSANQQMFDQVGPTPVHNGEVKVIESNYKEGLTAKEYFDKNYYARNAMITKGVGTSKPGYAARKLFYSLSDVRVMNDCGGPYIDAMHCKLPDGHVCIHCAHMTKGGETVHEGDLIGGVISTALSEGLTQASMEQKHTGTIESMNKGDSAKNIMGTLDAWSGNPTIEKMRAVKTTEERRKVLYEGLKEEYARADIKQDDFNLQMIAKRLTSYKKEGGLRPVQPDECCDIVSMLNVGSANNIFRNVELNTGYKFLTKPIEQELHVDAANQILN